MHVSDNSITFTRNIYSTEEDLFKVSKIGDATVISGITLIDSLIENTGDVLSDDSNMERSRAGELTLPK